MSVRLFGVNERSRKILEVLFSMYAKGRYRLDEGESPHVAIVDMDGVDAKMLWSDYRSHYPDLSTIVISFRGEAHPGAVSLKKPVTAQSLLDALASLRHVATDIAESMNAPAATESQQPELVSHVGDLSRPDTVRSATAALAKILEDGGVCGDAEDIDPRDSKHWPAIYYNPENHFQSACRQTMRMALQTGQIQQFVLGNLKYPLVCLPEQGGQVITLASHDKLRFFLCRTTLHDIADAITRMETLPPDLEQSPRIPFERFMWEVSLWSSHGHLPEGTPIDVPLRLKYWPNFTRLTETPHAMSIAALWCRQPSSLLRTCQILGVPQRYVFGFYSAANSAGLIEWQVDHRESDHRESGAPLPCVEHQGEQERRENGERRIHGSLRGLFGRILSHLRHN